MFNFRERQQKGRGRQERAVFQQGAPTGNVTPLSSGLIGLVAHLVNLASIAKGTGSIPDSVTSHGVRVIDLQLKILSGLYSPRST